MTELGKLLRRLVRENAHGFSVGGLGAIAEFEDLPLEVTESSGAELEIAVRGLRGAMHIQLTGLESALAYELQSKDADGWQLGLVIVGSADAFRMSGRKVLTELGQDRASIYPSHRSALLFDIGADLPNIDFCIRTQDIGLVSMLRRHVGETILTKGNPTIETLIDASPNRVVMSRISRIEVYQPIGRTRTPPGPHTHLLPDLLSRRRTHSANIPIPAGYLPLLTIHPENPMVDAYGKRRGFVKAPHSHFDRLLELYGNSLYVSEKRRFVAAIVHGRAPEDYVPADSRVGRLAQRIALRQLRQTINESSNLNRWLTYFTDKRPYLRTGIPA